MTEAQTKIIDRGEKAKKWVEANWGMHIPSEIIAMEKCPCGRETSFIWGVKNEKGQTRYLHNENGAAVKKCGACMIDEDAAIEKTIIEADVKRMRQAEEKRRNEKESKNKTSWGPLKS